MARTMTWRTEGRVQVVLHGKQSPSRLEWQRYLSDLLPNGALLHEERRIVVVSNGGAPDGEQRRQMAEVVGKWKKPPLALLTDSPIVRGMVAALRIFNPSMRAFRRDELASACLFLELAPGEAARVTELVAELRAEIGKDA